MQNGVDIVIPIYNGYEDIQMCMESIKRYTNLEKNRVLLINDCSPDERIIPYLDSIQDKNIILISNERNLGFSANVNKGMAYSKRDVILLNSDTIVTKNWVEKIVACAYSEPEIATVTPLSNSATLCSIPIMCQDNPIPENCSIDELAQIVEKYSLKKYPRITVAVGFCMFIKREVIDLVGTFDVETYERGYGEENDFCNRAEQYGYKHVMCDDTFIYHKGTASFNTEEKRKLCEQHDRILKERYPAQMFQNHLYCVTNPDQDIRDNICLHLALKNGKKNILYVLQADFREESSDHIGGTQFHVKDLTEGLRFDYNIFVLARDGEYMRLTAYVGDCEYVFSFYVGRPTIFPMFTNSKLKKLYEDILEYFNIQMIHIHHTLNHSMDLYYVAERLNIPVLLTLHDYYYVCPNVKLYDDQECFCANLDKKDCRQCLKITTGVAKQVCYIDYWREKCRKALSICKKLIFPSEAAREIVLDFYPEFKDKALVIEHGSDTFHREYHKVDHEYIKSERVHFWVDDAFGNKNYENVTRGWAYLEGVDNRGLKKYLYIEDSAGRGYLIKGETEAREDVCQMLGVNRWYEQTGFWMNFSPELFENGMLKISAVIEQNGVFYRSREEVQIEKRKDIIEKKAFRVAFLGGLVPAKGSKVALDLIREESEDIEWYAFGQIGDAELLGCKSENFHKIGPYQREEIHDLLEKYQIDLVCILPKWAETFCYTLSEAVLNGIPVLVFDIGAVGLRVKKEGYGWVVPLDATVSELIQIIREIKNNSIMYEEKARRAKLCKIRSISEMTNCYRSLYEKEAAGICTEKGSFDAREMFTAFVKSNI